MSLSELQDPTVVDARVNVEHISESDANKIFDRLFGPTKPESGWIPTDEELLIDDECDCPLLDLSLAVIEDQESEITELKETANTLFQALEYITREPDGGYYIADFVTSYLFERQ